MSEVQASFSAASATDTDRALDEAQRWIEACTGTAFACDNFRLCVRDGVLLCRLADVIQEGSVNLARVQTGAQATFMWLENLNYFIKACKKLGLKGGQLFDPTDLIIEDRTDAKSQSGKRTEQERRVRNVAITVYWLGRIANRITTFAGPKLNLTEFSDIVPGQGAAEPEEAPQPPPEPTPEPPEPVVEEAPPSPEIKEEEIVETEVITTVTREVRRVVTYSPRTKARQTATEEVSESTTVEEKSRPAFTRKSSASELRLAFMRRPSDANLQRDQRARAVALRSSNELTPGRKSGTPDAQGDTESVAISLDLHGGEEVFGFALSETEPGQPTCVASVDKGSAAERGDLRVGDNIFWLNGETVAFASKSEVDSLVAVIVTKEKGMTLGIRRVIPRTVEEVPEPEPEPEVPTKVEEEVVAVMVAQEECGPADLAAALKEFEEKAGPAEMEEDSPAEAVHADQVHSLPGEDVVRGFSTYNTGVASAAASKDNLEKVDESCEMQRLSEDQSVFTPHGHTATVYVARPPPKQDSAEDDLVALLRRLQAKYGEQQDKEKYDKLVGMVSTSQFRGVMEAHRTLSRAQPSSDEVTKGQEPACPVCRQTQNSLSKTDEDAETKAALAQVMAAPHFRGLCWAHDQMLLKKKQESSAPTPEPAPVPASPPTPEPAATVSKTQNVNAAAAVATAAVVSNGSARQAESEPVTKEEPAAAPAATPKENGLDPHQPQIVTVEKQAGKPLGATIRTDNKGRVFLARLIAGSTLAQSGKFHEDDELLEVNDTTLTGMSMEDIADLMRQLPIGELQIKIIPSNRKANGTRNAELNVRALFDYDPTTDDLLPCQDVGLAFQKGDILHVVNQQDADWWQAVKEGSEEADMAGLIPSKYLQERRDTYQHAVQDDAAKTNGKKRKKSLMSVPKRKKKKSSLYDAKQNAAAYSLDEVLTYEEVILVQPDPSKRRPIVIIGPVEGGREALKVGVVDHDPSRFATAIPHTTRLQRGDEDGGVVYHFISQKEFEQRMQRKEFFEHGSHNGNFYGTSVDAVVEVIMSGRTCVITAHPDSLKLLTASNMQPYVIFLRPPVVGASVSDESKLAKAVEVADKMGELYGHMFDKTIVNSDDDVTLHEFLDTAHFLQTQPQWVHLMRR